LSLAAGTAAWHGVLPAWAKSATHNHHSTAATGSTAFDLSVGSFPIDIDGKPGRAVGVNGTVPAPLVRFREGDDITINVTNHLPEDTSIHWHGLLVPFYMDGVPGVSFPGIKPGETFTYQFSVPQFGTYWYHSHSGLQEQLGHYGPIIIDPAGHEPAPADREYVIVLSDWSFESPHRIFSKLKKNSEVYNFQEQTFPQFLKTARRDGLKNAMRERGMWGRMRMSPADIADVTGATYHYLINGHGPADNWTGVFNPGERVKLRIINASAMTLFNFRLPGLPMQVVAADGLAVKPVETDEFQIGVAETYDVIIEPKPRQVYAIVAESIDRSGMAVGTLAPRPGLRAEAPPLRGRPTLTMRDMGMAHHESHDAANEHSKNPSSDHSGMDHAMHGHQDHHAMGGMNEDASDKTQSHDHIIDAGVDGVADVPVRRLDEPGLGLENVPHRALTYSQLESLDPNPDQRPPTREIELHLTGNMERYMWSFDGIKFSEVVDPIIFNEGERLRLTLVNDTMMSHPIHLHGMFFDLVNGAGNHKPRKHTIIVKPGEILSVDVTADAVGDWPFHCHLLFHMHAGMMQVVSVRPKTAASAEGPSHSMHHASPDDEKHGGHH